MKRKKKIEKIKVRRRKTKKQKSPMTKVEKFDEKVLSGEIIPAESNVFDFQTEKEIGNRWRSERRIES